MTPASERKGRRLRTDSLVHLAQLCFLGGLKGWRRRAVAVEHLERWLKTALERA